MTSAALLICSSVLFLSHCSSLANGEDAQSYHVVQNHNSRPEVVCSSSKVSSFSGSNATALPLVHRHGPCSPFDDKKLLSLEEILLKDQLRVNYLWRSALKPSAKPQVDDSKASIPTEYGGRGYVITVGYGTPSQEQTVIMDTGSDLSWIKCKPRNVCYSQKEPIFDPSQSSSYAAIPCNSSDCSQLPSSCSSSCAYVIQYGSGPKRSGVYSYDRLTLSPNDVIEPFLFGCGTDNERLFLNAAGLVGLGRGKRSLVSQTSQVYQSVFSYCLPSTPSSTGFLKLGEPGDASNTVYTRMQTSSSFYFVDLIGISVGGQQLDISPSVFSSRGTIIDSGTTITRLPASAYGALRSAFRCYMSQYPAAPPTRVLDTCYDFSGYETITVPKVALLFDGVTMDLDISGILMHGCLAFTGYKGGRFGIIGNVQQQTFEVVYDLGNERIGFVPQACS
ncbi:aspartyl protease family protein At5g10770 isoform X1 [Musa acuminata AAA Group]|uniref:aspartyl protease family protein At5g10770 isoform X1 n=1 Tax=Musa acuminata AAA Group TaxID=214697 RepID=UPI0031CE94E2